MWHLVGAGAPRGAAGPSPGQLRPAMASCGQLRAAVVRPDLARCDRSYTIALVHPSMVHLSIVIPIFVYLQEKMPTQLAELY
jgi:hypothetical protein